MNKIIELIEEVKKSFYIDQEPFSFSVLSKKRDELLALCKKLGDKEEVFKNYLNSFEINKKYSIYSSSCWGYYTPSIIENYASVNVHRPKRLFSEKLNKEHFYEYLYNDNKLIAIKYYYKNKNTVTHYFLRIQDSLFSFCFRDHKDKFVEIFELTYDDFGNVLTFANLESWSENLEANSDFIKHNRYMFQDCNLLDYHYFHNNNGVIDFVDYYTRIYNFSPSISGLKLGSRFYFQYDDTKKIIGKHSDRDFFPCIFDNQENQKTADLGKK